MPSTHYGISAGGWTPQPDFTASRSAEGQWTASQTYVMPLGTWEASAADSFTRGTPIPSVFTEIQAKWAFLQIESVEVSRKPGSLVEVRVSFTGFDEAEYPEGDEEETYILAGTRVERSILTHPLYIKEVVEYDSGTARFFSQAYDFGSWAEDTRHSVEGELLIYHVPSDGAEFPPNLLTDRIFLKWWDFIFTKGNRTYMAPTLQWTLETANVGGLEAEDVAKLGLVDDPPGNPPQPFNGDFEWIKVSLDDVRARGSSSNSQTWELSPPGGFPSFNPDLNDSSNNGPYDYDLADISL